MASPAAPSIPVEQYLRTVYRPDRDYIDGAVLERNLGEREHAAVQMALAFWFRRRNLDWNIQVYPELRVRVSQTRYRIPDVCVLRRGLPREAIPTRPPLICIEVLSPEDTPKGTRERLEDFERFGVANIWLIDPQLRRGWAFAAGELCERGRFEVAGEPIYLSLAELFAEVD